LVSIAFHIHRALPYAVAYTLAGYFYYPPPRAKARGNSKPEAIHKARGNSVLQINLEGIQSPRQFESSDRRDEVYKDFSSSRGSAIAIGTRQGEG